MTLETLCPSPMVSMEMAKGWCEQVGMSHPSTDAPACFLALSTRHWPTRGMLGGWAGRRGEQQAGVRGDGERGRRVKRKGSRKIRPCSGCILPGLCVCLEGRQKPRFKGGRTSPPPGAPTVGQWPAVRGAAGHTLPGRAQGQHGALRLLLCAGHSVSGSGSPAAPRRCLASQRFSPRADFPLLILLSHARWIAGLLISEESFLFCVSFNQKGFWRPFHLQ